MAVQKVLSEGSSSYLVAGDMNWENPPLIFHFQLSAAEKLVRTGFGEMSHDDGIRVDRQRFHLLVIEE